METITLPITTFRREIDVYYHSIEISKKDYDLYKRNLLDLEDLVDRDRENYERFLGFAGDKYIKEIEVVEGYKS